MMVLHYFFWTSEICFPSSTFIYVLLIMQECMFLRFFLPQYMFIFYNLGKWGGWLYTNKQIAFFCFFEKQRQSVACTSCSSSPVYIQGQLHSAEMTSFCFRHELIFPLYMYSTANKTGQFYLFLMFCQWTYC